ncbi:MAG: alpha-isopropylmalate synthase regulatory domain-containing protein, partial [Candidatus Limnocylindrales bacterium]
LGHELEGEALDAAYREVIALADAKKEVTDADLLAVVEHLASGVSAPDGDAVALTGWSVTSSQGGHAQGNVSLTIAGRSVSAEGTGNGPVDALFGAVDAAVEPVLGWHPVLAEYEIRAVSAGEDAQGQVVVRCRRSGDGPDGPVQTGHGLSTNIIEASLEGYLSALDKLRVLVVRDGRA